MAGLDQLTGLMDLLQKAQGSSQTQTTTGGKTTQQTQLSDAAVQEQIKRILAGPGGVRDVGGSARRSGLYNSTSEDLLLGNLYATAANQGEIARAPTVTTTAPSTTKIETPGVGLGTTLGTIAGGVLLSSLLKGGGNAITTGAGNFFSNLIGGTAGKEAADLTGAISFGAGPDTAAGLTFGTGSVGPIGGGFTGENFSTQMGQGLSGAFGGSTGASGNVSKSQDTDFDLMGAISSGLGGLFSGGGLGGALGAITGGTGANSSGGGSSGGSIICTALMSRGLLNEAHYAAGSKYIEQVSSVTKLGYYSWAAGVAEKIRKGNQFLTYLCLPFAAGRTALLASPGTIRDHFRHPFGTLTKFVGEPACWLIGMAILAKRNTHALVIKGE